MDGQMTIWDFMQEESLESLPEEEMVKQIGAAIGVKFVRNDFFGDWRANVGQSVLMLEYQRYDTLDEDNGKRFIGCGIDDKKNHCSAGAPKDSIKEAIEWFRKRKR